MDDIALLEALARAERALERIERSAVSRADPLFAADALRDKVRGVVAELDEMLAVANG
jgi:hypothetical protein